MRKVVLFLLLILSVFLIGCEEKEFYCNQDIDCNLFQGVHEKCVGKYQCIENACKWECNLEIEKERNQTFLDDIKVKPKDNNSKTLVATENETAQDFMTNALCQEYGGYWLECASSCRFEKDEAFCIEMCDQICMCGSEYDYACPPGYECRIYDEKENKGECILAHS